MQAIVRSRKAAKRDIQRAEIALLADQGEATQAIARCLEISESMVCK